MATVPGGSSAQSAAEPADEPAARWIGLDAVRWALDEAPDVPPHLVAALVAVASFAGEDGRGAYPSVPTLAAIIRKSERGVMKDLAALRQLGLLLLGDQDLAEHIRADRRPVVYDLPVPRGEPQVTPSAHGVNHSTERGEPQFRSGVNHSSPKQSFKNPEKTHQHTSARRPDGKAVSAAINEARRHGPACEHGEPGGAFLHPVEGTPLCPLCRNAS